jgi:hypothetical protein
MEERNIVIHLVGQPYKGTIIKNKRSGAIISLLFAKMRLSNNSTTYA